MEATPGIVGLPLHHQAYLGRRSMLRSNENEPPGGGSFHGLV